MHIVIVQAPSSSTSRSLTAPAFVARFRNYSPGGATSIYIRMHACMHRRAHAASSTKLTNHTPITPYHTGKDGQGVGGGGLLVGGGGTPCTGLDQPQPTINIPALQPSPNTPHPREKNYVFQPTHQSPIYKLIGSARALHVAIDANS